ncbi:MAG: hypothetical protein AAF170_13100 [Bacteroidota bacterium]
MRTFLLLAVCLGLSIPVFAQDAAPEDVASPEAIVAAVYASIEREPGAQFDWDRFVSLYIPEASLLPNPEQMSGEERVFSPRGYADFIDGVYESANYIGSPNDQGFSETEVNKVVHRFGDVATVFSTYEKYYWGDDQMLGRGINSFQLVYRDGRWWIVSVAWDEETGAGPVPEPYMPSGD